MSAIAFLLYFAFIFSFCILQGAFGVASFGELLHAKWYHEVKPSLMALTRAIVPLWTLFILVLIFKNAVFPWSAQVSDEGFRGVYLHSSFFILRGFFYLGLATQFTWILRRSTRYQAAFALVLILFMGSLASYDWILTQQKDFHSTIFGLLILIISCLFAYSFALFRTRDEMPADLRVDLNNILLAMLAIWTYFTFMQYLTIWSANLPQETTYYHLRSHGVLGVIGPSLLLLQGIIPIFLLVFKKLKRSPRFTHCLAAWTFFCQTLHLLWILGGNS